MRDVDRLNRVVLTVLGVLLLAAGVYGLLRSFDLLGGDQADRPVLEPAVLGWVGDAEPWFWPVVAGVAALVAVLGALWLRRQVRADPPLDWLTTADTETGRTRLRAVAVADALADDLHAQPGVTDASARVLADGSRPTVAARVVVEEDADLDRAREGVRQAIQRLEEVLGDVPVDARVRMGLGEPGGRTVT